MHLVIISGATRPMQKSNTAKIIAAFRKGFEEGGQVMEEALTLLDNGSKMNELADNIQKLALLDADDVIAHEVLKLIK